MGDLVCSLVPLKRPNTNVMIKHILPVPNFLLIISTHFILHIGLWTPLTYAN